MLWIGTISKSLSLDHWGIGCFG